MNLYSCFPVGNWILFTQVNVITTTIVVIIIIMIINCKVIKCKIVISNYYL